MQRLDPNHRQCTCSELTSLLAIAPVQEPRSTTSQASGLRPRRLVVINGGLSMPYLRAVSAQSTLARHRSRLGLGLVGPDSGPILRRRVYFFPAVPPHPTNQSSVHCPERRSAPIDPEWDRSADVSAVFQISSANAGNEHSSSGGRPPKQKCAFQFPIRHNYEQYETRTQGVGGCSEMEPSGCGSGQWPLVRTSF